GSHFLDCTPTGACHFSLCLRSETTGLAPERPSDTPQAQGPEFPPGLPATPCCPMLREKQRPRHAGSVGPRTGAGQAVSRPAVQGGRVTHLSIMAALFPSSQDWLPGEGRVRRLLCADPCCHICNTVALDITHLLAGGTGPTSSSSVGPPQGSPRLGRTAMPREPVQQNPEHRAHCSQQLFLPVATPVVSQFTDQKSFTRSTVQSPTAVSIRDYWTEHLQLTQQMQGPEVRTGPETTCSLMFEQPRAPVSQQLTIQTNSNLIYAHQGRQTSNSPVSGLTVSQELTTTTLAETVPLHMVTVLPAHPPILSPEAQRLLEVHVKKWMHFQRWGLPRRVEESVRQHLPSPPLFYRPEDSQPVSALHSDTPPFSVDNFGAVSYQNWGSCTADQVTQAFWISEWAIVTADRGLRYQQAPNHVAPALPPPALKDLSGPCALSGHRASKTVGHWQQKFSQLFCGLPSLHSESLVANFLGSPVLSLKNGMAKLPLKDPFLLKELSLLPCPPETPAQSAPPCSPPPPNQVAPSDRQQAHSNIPFLTLAECEALEWHVLQRHLQLQWGLPAVFQRSQQALGPAPYRSCDKARSPEALKTSWPGTPISLLPRDLLLCPEQARRLLGFHLQRQLIHSRWGLPQKIQQSFQLLLSADQQPLAWSASTAPASDSVAQAAALDATGTGAPSDPVPVPMPHLFAQAQEILQSHIDSKCGQIQQERVPVCVGGSWDSGVPGDQTCSPASEPSEPQAAGDPDPQQKHLPSLPAAPGRQPQVSPGVVAEHPKAPQALSKGAIEKLETTLRHKYLAFLSGLPALYYVALSMAMTPASTPPDGAADTGPRPAESPPAPLTQVAAPEEPRPSPEPCFSDSEETGEDAADEFQAEVQVGEAVEAAPLESRAEPLSPILSKLNFHLRKKILEVQLGIPTQARQSREHAGASSESVATPEPLASPHDQGNRPLQEIPPPPDSPRAPDPEWLGLHGQLAFHLKAGQQNQTQPGSRAASPGSAHWASKAAQPSGDMTKAQVLCVQLEASMKDSGPEEPWAAEHQSPGKGTDSAPAPEVAEQREKPGKPKSAGDHGEGDAGFALSSTREESPRAEEAQSPARSLLSRTRRGLWQRSLSRSFHRDASCPRGPQHRPQLRPPEHPPRTPGPRDAEKHRQAKGSVVLKPPKTPQNAPPVAPRAAQCCPFQGPLLRGKLPLAQTWQGQGLQAQLVPVHSRKRLSLPESGLRNKIKSFLRCISPKPKAKGPEYSMPWTAQIVAQARKDKVDKSRTPAKSSPLGPSETEKIRGNPKAVSPLTEDRVGGAYLKDPHSPHSKLLHRLRTHSRKPHLASVLGRPRYCPRHCPRGTNATQPGNPP
ncbi:Protein FAM205A, partial [Galemys pyrenaicus]